jgi:RNA polymerase primary sigma factor
MDATRTTRIQGSSGRADAPAAAIGRAADGVRFMQDDDGLAAYLREIADTPVLTYAQERDLLKRMRQGDKRAFKDLITANLRFVVSVCRMYRHQGLPLIDLISEGNLGLIRAAQSFDETRTCRFISYAVWWVRQRIQQALAEQSRNISLPVGKAALLRKMGHVRKKLEQERSREADASEVAEAMSIKEREACNLMRVGRAPLSLSEPSGGGGETPLEDMLVDESAESPDARIELQRRRAGLLDVLGDLKDLECRVLRLYFGLDQEPPITLEEISRRLDVSPERARQIKETAIGRLRHPTRAKRLLDFA